MLQLIRDRSQGLVVGVIVFFICLTFALFGVQQYLDAKGTVIIAEVEGEEISLTEFQRAFQQLRRRAQAMLGDSFNPDEWSSERAKLSTLDYVVNDRLLQQAAVSSNVRASDRQVADYIRTAPQFQQDGAFEHDVYRQVVRQIGFTEIGFERQVRRDIVTNQLRAGIAATAFATAEELSQLEQYRQQTRDVGYAIVGIESFRNESGPARADVEKYFDENKEFYRVEEKVTISYLDLSIEALMKDVAADEAQLRAYYDANRGNYTQQEQRNANHILIQVARDAAPEELEAARSKASGLREQALQGGSFETIAMENSDDVGSRTEGGETGFFGRGVMAPEFEEAVFSMSEGEISEPVKTEFGFHVIRLKEIKPGGIKTFDEAREDVEATYRREQAEALFFEQAELLSELVYEQPDTLEPAAETLSLQVKTVGPLTRAGLSAVLNLRAVEAAFDPEVLVDRLNSEPIEVNNGRIVVVRVDDHAPSRLPVLDDVIDEVTTDLSEDRTRDAVRSYGDGLVQRLKDGEDLSAVVSVEELQWEDVLAQPRNSSKLNRAIARAAFRVELPAGGTERVFLGVPLGTGDYAIVGVANVRVPLVEELNLSDISELRRELATQRAASSWRDFVELLKSDSEVELFTERL